MLSSKKKFHLYEYFGKDDKLKLYLDIDIKTHNIPPNSNKNDWFNKIVAQSIDLICNHIKHYNVINPQIIVLSACRKDKLSAHIIFNNVVFNNVYEMKYFMSNIKSQLIDNQIIDMNVYKKGCFRMLWNSKYGIGKNFEFYRGINYIYRNDECLFTDCLLRNISDNGYLVNIELPKNVKIIRKPKPKNIKCTTFDHIKTNHQVYYKNM